MSNETRQVTRTAYQAHLGGGVDVEMEVSGAGQLWVTAGSGIGKSDLWMKAVANTADFRVCISRTPNGFEIVLDRGDLKVPWWPQGAGPRLSVDLDRASETVSITAIGGASGEEGQSGTQIEKLTFPLGRIALGSDVREADA